MSMPSTPPTSAHFGGLIALYRIIAFLEALSWIALLIAMYYQFALHNSTYIHLTGMVHGCIFMLFVIGSLIVAKIQKWPLKIIIWALISSIPPICTAIFEIIIAQKGYLSPKNS